MIETGDPADAIVRTAEKQGSGLIVTGLARDETLGRSDIEGVDDRIWSSGQIALQRAWATMEAEDERDGRPMRQVIDSVR